MKWIIIFEHNLQRGDLYCSNGRLIYINTPQFPFIYFFGLSLSLVQRKWVMKKNIEITRRHFKKWEFNHLVCLETLISIATPWACLFCSVCLPCWRGRTIDHDYSSFTEQCADFLFYRIQQSAVLLLQQGHSVYIQFSKIISSTDTVDEVDLSRQSSESTDLYFGDCWK